jgi:hypothetical protein
VEKGFAEEHDRNASVLFPIRLDDTVMTTGMEWAEKIKMGCNIGDFRVWRCKAGYKKGLTRLLRDLRRW